MTGIVMFDADSNSEFPPGAQAYAAYVDGGVGDQPNYAFIVSAFPGAQHLSIALNPAHDADCLDIEAGAATPASAAAWYERQKAAGVSRPCLYASVSKMESDVVPAITAAGITRATVRLWTAHYGAGEHICGPSTCKLLSIGADATQWTDSADIDFQPRDLDQSLLLGSFFDDAPTPPPITYVEFDMSKLPVLQQGDSDKPGEFWSVRRMQSLVALTGSLNGLAAASSIRVDGSFGAATAAAVQAVQAFYKLAQDGECGQQTWGVLLTGSAS